MQLKARVRSSSLISPAVEHKAFQKLFCHFVHMGPHISSSPSANIKSPFLLKLGLLTEVAWWSHDFPHCREPSTGLRFADTDFSIRDHHKRPWDTSSLLKNPCSSGPQIFEIWRWWRVEKQIQIWESSTFPLVGQGVHPWNPWGFCHLSWRVAVPRRLCLDSVIPICWGLPLLLPWVSLTLGKPIHTCPDLSSHKKRAS